MRRALRLSFSIVALVFFLCGNTPESDGSDYWERLLRLDKDTLSSPALLPQDCRVCHPEQYAPWSKSLHSKSTGAGLMSQLNAKEPEFAAGCYFCHAPAERQHELILNNENPDKTNEEYLKNPAFNKQLRDSGVSCAVCHMRKGVINGPTGKNAPHKVRRNTLLKNSEFCSACHQLTDGFVLNGKPLINTYEEWLTSRFATEGVHCQNCHMPEAKHLFLGIHDKDTVRDALEITIKTRLKLQNKGLIKVLIKNTGAGHFLPTYVTPLIVVSGVLVDDSDNIIKESLQESLIGRLVTVDLSEEIMDTRIAPGKTHTFKYHIRYPKKTKDPLRALIQINVYPDNLYNKFFKKALEEGAYSSHAQMKKALRATERSPYLLFEKTIELKR